MPPNSDKPNGSTTSQTTNTHVTGSLEADVARLAALSSTESGSDDNSTDANIPELLARLTNADSFAQGVEGRLDAILDNLDELLGSLEVLQQEKSTNDDKMEKSA